MLKLITGLPDNVVGVEAIGEVEDDESNAAFAAQSPADPVDVDWGHAVGSDEHDHSVCESCGSAKVGPS